MKKYLFILIVSLFFGGSVFAQETHHWTCNDNEFLNNMTVAFWVTLDGNYVGNPDIQVNNYDYDIEIAAFVNDECRMSTFLFSVAPTLPLYVINSVHFSLAGEPVSFKMYIHSTGKEYDMCDFTTTVSENGCGSGDDPIILPFHTYFTKDITHYTGTSDHYYLIASPVGEVSPENVTDMLSPSYDLYYYDQTKEKEWVNYKPNPGNTNLDPEFSLEPGKGYLYANSNDVTLKFIGAPFTATEPFEVSLVYDAGANQNTDLIGWNLVGNPFPVDAYIDRDFFYRTNLENTELEAESGAIAPMEGVFVRATGTDDNTLNFSTTAPSKSGEQLIINLTQNRGVSIDRAIVSFDEGEMLPKFMLNENNTKLYIPQGNHDYAVVRSAVQGELPLNFSASKNGTYTLSIDTENVEMNYLHLIDNMTGMDVDLLQTSSYTFEANLNDYESRFKLVFAAACEDVEGDSESFAFFSNGNWVINNNGKATLQVIDVIGRILSSETVNGSVSTTINVVPGVYMFRLVNGDNVKVQKVVVR